MRNKAIVILVDGMASYAVKACKHPFISELLEDSMANLYSTTVMPSVTLPCHMSLFQSVPPQRHGILTNTYVPPVRPIDGLMDQLKKFDKVTGSFYNWEELRDLSRPGSINYSCYISQYTFSDSDSLLTDRAIQFINKYTPDFVFLYLGETDETGHNYGWGSDEYNDKLYHAWDCIEKVYRTAKNTYNLIVTADHGGHDRGHGSQDLKDMQIPIVVSGVSAKEASAKIKTASIMDIAPTVTAFLGVESNKYWQGQSLIEQNK